VGEGARQIEAEGSSSVAALARVVRFCSVSGRLVISLLAMRI
jgi:hypothetical protein